MVYNFSNTEYINQIGRKSIKMWRMQTYEELKF